MGVAGIKRYQLFLSTLPARGATRPTAGRTSRATYFYPRSPRGERRGGQRQHPAQPAISIHAPREGSDIPTLVANIPEILFLSTLPARGATSGFASTASAQEFLSTLPARGATLFDVRGVGEDVISIHAPREGSDEEHKADILAGKGISIHAPREGSDDREYDADTLYWIISIHAPREGSDRVPLCLAHSLEISIHAPREGSDTSLWVMK